MKADQDNLLRIAINSINSDPKPIPSEFAKSKLIEAIAYLKRFGYGSELVESVVKIVQKFSNDQTCGIIARLRQGIG